MFADYAEITIKAGNGGNGLVSFRREIYVPAGGPDGGDGGKGGDVIFVVDNRRSTLSDFKHKRNYKAQNGQDGKAKKSFGADGEDLLIPVPEGTIIKDKKTGKVIADMTGNDMRFTAAYGGKGGWGNTHFATPTRQAPRFAKNGIQGVEQELILELKTIADVGLIGFPNVGKSTLLSTVSEARPKIANYHFTTLEPSLGVVDLGEGRSFVLADIPGIIEGAHEGVGLGHDFLRHVERTRLLLHVVDVSGIEGRNPIDDFETINNELQLYNPELAQRPQIVVANKTDILTDPKLLADFKAHIEAKELLLFEISAATKKGIRELMEYTGTTVSSLAPVPIYTADYVEEELDSEGFTVNVEEDGVYNIEGGFVDKLLRGINFEDEESTAYFQRALRKRGIITKLEELGIQEGDPVRMGDIEFDFIY